jgi:hypothetical protein
MTQINPYQPPSAEVILATAKRPIGPMAWSLIALIALQVILSFFYAPKELHSVSVGEVAPFTFLFIALSTLLLVLGAVLFVSKSRAPIYVFAFSSAFGVLALWQSQWLLLPYVTGAILSVSACVYSIMHNRQNTAETKHA